MNPLLRSVRTLLVVLPLAGLALGFALPDRSAQIWTLATLPVLATLFFEIATTLAKGEVGLDLVAAISMTFALLYGEPLAAIVVALMYASGQFLENFAEQRARREMTALLNRVPDRTMRYSMEGLEDVPIADIVPGDRLLVRHGDVVPVDGKVTSSPALLDEAVLTGEPLPRKHAVGALVRSGATNVGDAFDLEAIALAAESTYAGIVRLVEGAQAAKAPMVRLADRYAVWFLALTLAIAGAAWWASNDPIRALAVLVCATPCPLILAVPVAVVSGMLRAASRGMLVKGGGVLEKLADARTLVADKTGTLTVGEARVAAIEPAGKHAADDVLALAASLDQASPHVIARALVAEAHDRGLPLSPPTRVTETAGSGIAGHVGRHRVAVGGIDFVASHIRRKDKLHAHGAEGELVVAVAIDGAFAGHIRLADEVRPDARSLLDRLRAAGVRRVVLASGDRPDVVARIGAELGVDEAKGGLAPNEKVETVIAERGDGNVVMAGDGVNDAPALAAADVGIAMGARGSAASSEAADAVLLVDDLGRVADAVAIAKRTLMIARQSVFAGLGLSIAAMIAAAFGYLVPVEGAILQEFIDVAVILNALRALR
ncbi:MAG: heavy metal translocating P-type ATPase [Hyphomicrobiales bacterium]